MGSNSRVQVSTPGAPARGRARNNTRLHALAESCTRCLFRAKRPFAQWCVSPECKFGPDRDRRLDTGGAAQSATPYGRLKFSPRSRPNYLRKVTSEGRCSMGVSTPGAPARGRARNNTRLHALAESCTRCLFRAKRPFAQWCVSPECKFGPDRDRRLDTGGAAQSATPYGRLKFSPRSRPNYLRKVTSEGRCSMGARASSARPSSRKRRCEHRPRAPMPAIPGRPSPSDRAEDRA